MSYVKQIMYVMLVSSLLFSSCVAIHRGSIANSVAINSPNFTFIYQNIQGRSRATYVLGVGGMNRESLIAEAKKDMSMRYPLKERQAYSNYAVNFKTSIYLGVVITVDCFVSADVVEFTAPGLIPSAVIVPPQIRDSTGNPIQMEPGQSSTDTVIDRYKTALDKLETDGLSLVFRDNESGLKFYTYDYYLVKKPWQKEAMTYAEMQIMLQENSDLKGFFLPTISELKLCFQAGRISTSVHDGIFWSQDPENENTVRCLEMNTGKVVLKSISESCMLLPIIAVKTPR